MRKHLLYNIALVLGLVLFGVLFVVSNYSYTAQVLSALGGCIFYIAWGIVHHAVEGRLSRFIVLEYVLVGSLIFLLLFSALNVR